MTGPGKGPVADPGTGPASEPHLRVVRGEPTAEELAALVAVLTAVAPTPGPDPQPAPSAWSAPSRRMRAPASTAVTQGPGRGGWRASGLPR